MSAVALSSAEHSAFRQLWAVRSKQRNFFHVGYNMSMSYRSTVREAQVSLLGETEITERKQSMIFLKNV